MAHLSVAMEGPDAGTFEIKMEDVFTGDLYVRRYPFDAAVVIERTYGREHAERVVEAAIHDYAKEFGE